MADKLTVPRFALTPEDCASQAQYEYLLAMWRYIEASGPEGTNAASIGTLLSGNNALSNELANVAGSLPDAVNTAAAAGTSTGSGMTLASSAFGVSASGNGPGAYTTGLVTVTPSGGTAPYAHAWTRVSGSTLIVANSPSAGATTFTGTVPTGGFISAIFRDTVTDSTGTPLVETVDVSVQVFDLNIGGVGAA